MLCCPGTLLAPFPRVTFSPPCSPYPVHHIIRIPLLTNDTNINHRNKHDRGGEAGRGAYVELFGAFWGQEGALF